MAAYSRVPQPFLQPVNGSGVPYPSGKLYFYTANTSTPLDTYSDANLSVPNANPVVADANGRFGAIYLGSGTYDIVLKDSADAVVWTAEDVSVASIAAASTTVAGSIEIATSAEALAGSSTSLAMTPGTTAAAIQRGFSYAAAGGTADVITATLSPALTGYASGQRISVRIASANTGAVTLNVNSLGAVAVKKATDAGNTALAANDLLSGIVYDFIYDGASSCFWVVGPHVFQTVTVAATQAEMEANSSTSVWVTPGRSHFHPGVAKFWAVVTVSGGTPTLQTSYNVTSITDTALGKLTVTIGTDFSSANWCCLVNGENSAAGDPADGGGTSVTYYHENGKAAGSVVACCVDGDVDAGADFNDPASWSVAGFGDHA